MLQQPIISSGRTTISADYKVNWQPNVKISRSRRKGKRRTEKPRNGRRPLFEKRRRRSVGIVREKSGNRCKRQFQRGSAGKTKWETKTRKKCGKDGKVKKRTSRDKEDVRERNDIRERKDIRKRKDVKKRRYNRKRKVDRKGSNVRKRKINIKRKINRKRADCSARSGIKDENHSKAGKYLQSKATINEEWSYLERYLLESSRISGPLVKALFMPGMAMPGQL